MRFHAEVRADFGSDGCRAAYDYPPEPVDVVLGPHATFEDLDAKLRAAFDDGCCGHLSVFRLPKTRRTLKFDDGGWPLGKWRARFEPIEVRNTYRAHELHGFGPDGVEAYGFEEPLDAWRLSKRDAILWEYDLGTAMYVACVRVD